VSAKHKEIVNQEHYILIKLHLGSNGQKFESQKCLFTYK